MADRRPKARRATAHAFSPADSVTKRTTVRPVPWVVCAHCGLIALRNEATQRAARAACPGLLDDPSPSP